MKKLILALAAALLMAPVAQTFADDAATDKPKRKLNMKTYFNQMAPAMKDAQKFETPILVVVMLDDDEKSQAVNRYLLNNKHFKKFASANFVTLVLKGKKNEKDKKTVDKKSFKKNWDMIEKFAMDADRKAVTDTADMASKYPTAFFVSADCEKKLAHLPKYDPELGFGAWAMEVVAKMEAAGVSAVVSPELKKAIENPQPDVRQAAPKGKKK